VVLILGLNSPRRSGGESMVLNDMVATVSLVLKIKILVFVTIGNLVGWNFAMVLLVVLRLGLDSPGRSGGESMILNNWIAIISLALEIEVLHSVAVGNLVRWVLLEVLGLLLSP
jgi:hypothetical protein